MSTITFDSMQLVRELKRVGIQQEHAEAIVAAIVAAQDTSRNSNINQIFAPVFTDLAVIKWMMVFAIAGIFYLLFKS